MKRWMTASTALATILIVSTGAQGAQRKRVPQRQTARPAVQRQLDDAMAQIRAQQQRLDQQAADLTALRQRLDERSAVAVLPANQTAPQPAVLAAQGAAPGGGDPGSIVQAPPVAPLERWDRRPCQRTGQSNWPCSRTKRVL